ncbi:MAG: hypothetical protein LBC74_13770 [Planctomycetaceae bacterium]|jgi:enamine deaminase RidA (YjgF/YER057c/UK114 family)|nr:hypothetical protein [Planctomycetaceae bacterium]
MRKSNEKISYSVVPFGTAKQIFIVAEPQQNYITQPEDQTQGHGKSVPDYQRQIRSLIESIRDVILAEGFGGCVVMSNFFLADIAMRELVRQIAEETCPDGFGAMTIISQAPVNGAVCSAEIWGIAGKNMTVQKSKLGNVVLAQVDMVRWFFGGDFRPQNTPIGAYNRSIDAFKNLKEQLIPNQFLIEQLVRTWIYQGHLVLADKVTEDGILQRYQELNRARTDFFSDTKFLNRYIPKKHKAAVFPASTGIGADDVDVVISAIAVDSLRSNFTVVPLENPNQTSAFSYGVNYSPQSPKFARGMVVNIENWCQIFVSGTASITSSESQYGGDPAMQTEQTLNNIAALISGENLAKHGLQGFESGLDKLECVRVYVKNPDDFGVVEAICRKRLGDTPILYTVADVCRPELLVEIEGFAVTTKKS